MVSAHPRAGHLEPPPRSRQAVSDKLRALSARPLVGHLEPAPRNRQAVSDKLHAVSALISPRAGSDKRRADLARRQADSDSQLEDSDSQPDDSDSDPLLEASASRRADSARHRAALDSNLLLVDSGNRQVVSASLRLASDNPSRRVVVSDQATRLLHRCAASGFQQYRTNGADELRH